MNNSWSDVLRLGSWGAGSAVVVVLVVGQPFCNCVCKLSVFYALPQPKAFATSSSICYEETSLRGVMTQHMGQGLRPTPTHLPRRGLWLGGNKLVVWDFDLTLLKIHSFAEGAEPSDVAAARWKRDVADSDLLQTFVERSRELGVALSIASFGRTSTRKSSWRTLRRASFGLSTYGSDAVESEPARSRMGWPCPTGR